jgi:hypothetical protein
MKPNFFTFPTPLPLSPNFAISSCERLWVTHLLLNFEKKNPAIVKNQRYYEVKWKEKKNKNVRWWEKWLEVKLKDLNLIL